MSNVKIFAELIDNATKEQIYKLLYSRKSLKEEEIMLKILEQIRIEQLIISISTLMLVSLLISGYKDKKNKYATFYITWLLFWICYLLMKN